MTQGLGLSSLHLHLTMSSCDSYQQEYTLDSFPLSIQCAGHRFLVLESCSSRASLSEIG
jgi:hypothetical protein